MTEQSLVTESSASNPPGGIILNASIRRAARWAILAIGAAAAVAVGVDAAFAATSASQSVTFSVASAVSITSGGNVTIATPIDPSSGTPSGSATGTLNMQSDDHNGIQVTAQA